MTVKIARLNDPLKEFVYEEDMTVGELAEKAGITLASNDVINTDEGEVVKARDFVEDELVYSITKNYKNGNSQ